MRKLALEVLRLVPVLVFAVAPLSSHSADLRMFLSSAKRPLYSNRVFDFSVALPPGVIYSVAIPPNPDHGLNVLRNDNAVVWVDASYTDSSSIEQEVQKQTAGCRIEFTKPVKLGKLPAILLRFSCDATAHDSPWSEQVVLSVKQYANLPSICYQVGIRRHAWRSTFKEDNDYPFENLIAGFSGPR